MNKIDVYRQATEHLEHVVGIFEQELGKPVFRHGTYTYESPTVKHVCLLKAVRIVSGLNALLVLFEAGYATEMGILIRAIGDCMNAIYFLLEHFPDTALEAEKYVSDFFQDIIEEPELLAEQGKKTYRTKVKKIHASRARLLSEHINFPIDRDLVYKTYSAYSGYVHAAYRNIMEMYGGQPEPKFRMQGMKGTTRISDWEAIFVAFVRSSALVFGYMAEKYGKLDLIHEIRKMLSWFERQLAQMEPVG
jgi:hypothetical protein